LKGNKVDVLIPIFFKF